MAPIPVIDMFDTTTGKVTGLPANEQAAGYTTGSGIAWTPAQFAAHTTPHPAVRIDQDAGAADPTADILDVERGAATLQEIVHWLTLARASFINATRPGQRWPGIYLSLSDLTSAVTILQTAGISNVPFGIPDLTNRNDAIAKVSSATGPFPRVWQQYQFGSQFDSGIVSETWLTKVSAKVTPPPPPTTQAHWAWCRKCQTLFYGPNVNVSRCTAGGQHDPAQSGNYILNLGLCRYYLDIKLVISSSRLLSRRQDT